MLTGPKQTAFRRPQVSSGIMSADVILLDNLAPSTGRIYSQCLLKTLLDVGAPHTLGVSVQGLVQLITPILQPLLRAAVGTPLVGRNGAGSYRALPRAPTLHKYCEKERRKGRVSANCQRSGGTFQCKERALESICVLVIPAGHFWRETSEWRILSKREVFTPSCQRKKGCGGSSLALMVYTQFMAFRPKATHQELSIIKPMGGQLEEQP
ncbi:hypothetical protein DPX16_4123 [Anabarilius grahami]|uniref:Uncharacterized protein n=1 Tax=Anabarilius grahami TaxID=495550 RepID=A0A3N0Y059_ANAGA|nr:hypothetical protein DPX16_4123 [Anabarilius grahami]